MANLVFAIPLNLGIATWSVIGISSLGFLIMFGISSAKGDFQDLVKITLENDKKSRVAPKQNKK